MLFLSIEEKAEKMLTMFQLTPSLALKGASRCSADGFGFPVFSPRSRFGLTWRHPSFTLDRRAVVDLFSIELAEALRFRLRRQLPPGTSPRRPVASRSSTPTLRRPSGRRVEGKKNRSSV